MLYFMKPLPGGKIDITDWKPFIKNQWFRNNFIYFVYCLQVVLLISSIIFGVWHFSNTFIKVSLFICTYVIHELLHMIVIYKVGDISITHSGIFLWITSGAILSKLRFFVFMSLPFIGLTVIPAIVSVFISGEAKNIAIYIAWLNSIIAGADIINSVLIAIKPNNSLFYRGYYKTKSSLPSR
ncbi:MAG: DUF3267 domain-containing protein [bacterium]|nr:DUF3267 domain-containing protein [bacterium]